jgi:hypothetical protein
MFNQSIDDRLSLWAEHRQSLNTSDDPLMETWEFWKHTPFIPFNKNIDPFNHKSWPTPWEIIVHNRYDDFTKSLMIAWSLKYTNRFKEAKIEIKTIVNDSKTCYYNVVCVDNKWAINYSDNGPIPITDIPESFFIENQVEVKDTW